MFQSPVTEGFEGTQILMPDENSGGMVMMDAGPPHISYAAMILMLLALKAFTESDVASLDVKEVRVSALNIVNIGLQAVVFIIALKLANAALLRKGVKVPGLPDLVGAI